VAVVAPPVAPPPSVAPTVTPVAPNSEATAVKPAHPVTAPPSKPEVEKALANARERVAKLPVAGTRRIVQLGLAGLEERLQNGEAPAVIARELRALLKQYDLA
jgi:hypothetical protein